MSSFFNLLFFSTHELSVVSVIIVSVLSVKPMVVVTVAVVVLVAVVGVVPEVVMRHSSIRTYQLYINYMESVVTSADATIVMLHF
jgi:hypothetical protein